jgi:hypothetical protein
MKNVFFTVLCIMAMLVGCQQAEEIQSNSEELQMKVEASIGKTKAVASRYAGDTPNEVAFTDGDAIGLSVNGKGIVKWTTSDGTNWAPKGDDIHWENKTEEHEFCAFYPFVEEASLASVKMPDLTKQKGEMSELGTYDFLTASMVAAYEDDGVVSLEFEHELALITIKLKNEGDLVSSIINQITIAGDDIVTPGTYSLSDSDLSLSTDDDKKENSLDVTLNESFPSDGKTYYFVVNPQTVALSEVSLTITYKDKNNKTHTATLAGLGDSAAKFECGKEYSYALKVQSGALVISGNSINVWESGVVMNDIVINGVPAE